ncbi:MAG: zf-HC2 domain-containing protein [candidate division Zixibacteria bacterium]|nr:zf-HC2 domain-containing protein [candidate division Zixibacteria bacterium]MDH3937745.1 zf-HC2 domain-containing protein [candidate division Zixibacteria bacterium]MDH4033085.1 zf-HC2 domain-containing protein [candidate division Zixibacteria bacterium]
MNCEQYRQLISARVDTELTEQERGSLEEHLTQCSECEQYSEQINELERLTAEWEEAQMPADVEQAILAGTKREPGGWLGRLWSGSYHVPRPIAWAALAVLLFLSVNSLMNRDNSTPAEQLIISPEDSQPVQRIILTEADVVRTFTTGASGTDL